MKTALLLAVAALMLLSPLTRAELSGFSPGTSGSVPTPPKPRPYSDTPCGGC